MPVRLVFEFEDDGENAGVVRIDGDSNLKIKRHGYVVRGRGDELKEFAPWSEAVIPEGEADEGASQ